MSSSPPLALRRRRRRRRHGRRHHRHRRRRWQPARSTGRRPGARRPARRPASASAPTSPPTEHAEPTPRPTTTGPPSPVGRVPVYFAGDTPSGPRLYREFQRDGADPRRAGRVRRVAGSRRRPDYRHPVAGRRLRRRRCPPTATDHRRPSARRRALHDLPSGMTQARGRAGAAAGRLQRAGRARPGPGRRPVPLDGGRTDQVLGSRRPSRWQRPAPSRRSRLVSLTSPAEGQTVSGDTLEGRGRGQLLRGQRDRPAAAMRQGDRGGRHRTSFTAEGWMGDKLFPFSGTIDISGLAARRVHRARDDRRPVRRRGGPARRRHPAIVSVADSPGSRRLDALRVELTVAGARAERVGLMASRR